MFIDEIKITAQAGHGGKGCVAFTREAFRPKGGPSGGNGGRGGDVILEADHDINNLLNQFYNPKLNAQSGEHGKGQGMDGKAGKDLLVKVPCGTLVWRVSQSQQQISSVKSGLGRIRHTRTGQKALEIDLRDEAECTYNSKFSSEKELVVDLTEHGQQFTLCKGGRGGLGNRNFATARRQAPRFAQPGEPGEGGEFQLELRLMADVGLVGYPNAGKSTLLKAISAARPKIAPYPFTTLHPQVGIVEYKDFQRVMVCDIPGLIQGAHQNVGLGHAFLRHIHRCRILIILLDMAGTDGRKPWDDYRSLLEELELFDPAMMQKPRYVVANKMDQEGSKQMMAQFKRHIKKTAVLPISALNNSGLTEFLELIRSAIKCP